MIKKLRQTHDLIALQTSPDGTEVESNKILFIISHPSHFSATEISPEDIKTQYDKLVELLTAISVRMDMINIALWRIILIALGLIASGQFQIVEIAKELLK